MTSQVICESSNIVTAQVIDSTVHHIKKPRKIPIMPLCKKAPLTLKTQFRLSLRKKGDRNVTVYASRNNFRLIGLYTTSALHTYISLHSNSVRNNVSSSRM